ncbi:hypothetical protein EJ110_NYTH48672 [Nymphaea thermarum]|nr:hypothetical protein EJ110_NYTH48672 [Nymphaea thermarum]
MEQRDTIIDMQGEYKVSGNLLSFGYTVKLDGSNYEIWSRAHITPTIAYYTSAKHMWEFLKQTYSHDKNMSKVLQVEEELLKLQQGDSDLVQYFASVKSAYEPVSIMLQNHFEQHMVAKFLAGLSPDFVVAKTQMLTGAKIPDLAKAYNRLSRLAVTLSPSSNNAPSSALAVPGGHGQSLAISGSRGQTRTKIQDRFILVRKEGEMAIRPLPTMKSMISLLEDLCECDTPFIDG